VINHMPALSKYKLGEDVLLKIGGEPSSESHSYSSRGGARSSGRRIAREEKCEHAEEAKRVEPGPGKKSTYKKLRRKREVAQTPSSKSTENFYVLGRGDRLGDGDVLKRGSSSNLNPRMLGGEALGKRKL